MRIYYKAIFTGNHPESDLISVGMSADNGLSCYAEVNDYDKGKTNKQAEEAIASLLGPEGMKSLITARKKSKGLIAPGWRVNEFINGFLSPYDEINLVGYAEVPEIKSFVDLFDLELRSKRFSISNMEPQMVQAEEDLFDSVAIRLPLGNALRTALTYKHIVRRYER